MRTRQIWSAAAVRSSSKRDTRHVNLVGAAIAITLLTVIATQNARVGDGCSREEQTDDGAETHGCWTLGKGRWPDQVGIQ